MYIRDKRERTGNKKSAPPRERKTTNKKKTKKNEREREREREREKEAVVVVVSKVEGLKSSYHFLLFICQSVRVFLCGRRDLFSYMSY
jgi:hypothetical protein